jgi:O-antigen/teichoic acid export membrane protein
MMIVLGTGFIATPFLLRWLGEARFGAFRAASDWFAYLMFLELGVGGALLALLARAIGRGDDHETRRMLGAGIWWYLRIAGLMIAAGAALSLLITWLIPVAAIDARDLQRGLLVGLASILLLPFGAPFKALMESRQRGYWINSLLVAQSLTITSASLLLAWMGWGITGQFVALVCGALVFNLPLIWAGLRRYPGLLPAALREKPEASAHGDLRRLNLPTLVQNMCGHFSFHTDNIIAAFILGPTMVVPLFLTQKLITMVQGQLTSVGNASWAALADLHFQGQRELFNSRLTQLTSVVSVIGVAGLVPVAVYNVFFVSRWVGPEHYGGHWLSGVAALNALLLALYSLWGWCFGGTAQTPLLVRASLAQTFINVSASLVLTWRFGLIGPLLGTLIGFISVSAWHLPRLLHKVFGTSQRQLARAVLFPVLLGIPYAGALWWISRTLPPTGWFALGGQMAVAALAYLAVWWVTMMDPREREQVERRVAGMIGRPAAP